MCCQVDEERRSTEHGKIGSIEKSPSSGVFGRIVLALIDIPNDVLRSTRAVPRTNSKEGDLCRWIDPLIFKIRNTKSGNDTTKPMRIAVGISRRRRRVSFTQWRSIVEMFVRLDQEDNLCLEESDFVCSPS